MTKSLVTNLLAAAVLLAGLLIDTPYQGLLVNTGMFALAGGITNWLAIHMLFEKVPGLYGSGVIAAHFDTFKLSIKQLIMEQFFSQENMERFLADMVADHANQHVDLSDVIEQTDLSPAYDSLVRTIMESSFGSMLSMFGGESALTPLKEPFIEKMKLALDDMANSASFQQSVKDKLVTHSVFDDIHLHIEQIVQARLDELTPQMVKQIIQTMIREHLGWLVVWGGVFGGLIGMAASFLPLL